MALQTRNDYNETIAAVEKNYCPDGDCATEYVHETQGLLLGYVNDLRYISNELNKDADGILGSEDKNQTQWNET